MTAHTDCLHLARKRHGYTASGEQRFRCKDCGATFTEETEALGGMRIGLDKASQVVGMLCEGMSVRATSRLADVSVPTILELLELIGPRCKRFLQEEIRGVPVRDVQCDEIWQFVFCKRRTAQRLEEVGFGGPCGDSWCFTAVERHTKLVLAWHFGRRFLHDTEEFCRKLRTATAAVRFQLSTDGYQPYLPAVAQYLYDRVDYGMLVKIFGRGGGEADRKYSPAPIVGQRKEKVSGNPDESLICTSHTERNNGSIRCFMKRMGRLTYCFSKKWANHEHALAMHFAHFNFCRKHRTLKTTPAVASGLAAKPWSVLQLLEQTATA